MYEKLFNPLEIGKASIKNRIAMAPMNNFSFEQFDPVKKMFTKRGVDYYVERAKGGVGLINTGVFKVESDIERSGWPIVNEQSLNSLAQMVDTCHSYNTKVFIQMSAGAGRNIFPAELKTDEKPVSASENPYVWDLDVTCREIKIEEIVEIIEAHREKAELLAKVVGVDGIEVHGHEGYLMDQFTTKLLNKRDDEYGGDLEGRLKFPIDVLNVIKDVAGRDFPVTYRMGVRHFIKEMAETDTRWDFDEKGRDVEESKEIVQKLEKAGYDGFSLDTGCYDSWYYAHPPVYWDHGFSVELIKGFKELVDVPILTANRLDVPEVANDVIENNIADVVVIGRGLLADPYWPNKVRTGNIEDIRPCIGCQIGCLHNTAFRSRPLSCSVNPRCGREGFSISSKVNEARKVVVVGGGPAGMEVARVAGERGHDVTLFEKESELGGRLKEASAPDFKSDVRRLLDWYKVQIAKSGINVVLGKEATLADIKSEDLDALVIAVGGRPIAPDIPGIDRKEVVNCCELLRGEKEAGETVVVVGGGMQGCETALWLAEQGKKVIIVEMMDELMTRNMVFLANKNMLIDLLKEQGVEFMFNAELIEVTEGGPLVQTKSGKEKLSCDTTVLALGLESNTSLHEDVRMEELEIYNIGDSKEPRLIHDAIYEGFTVGNSL